MWHLRSDVKPQTTEASSVQPVAGASSLPGAACLRVQCQWSAEIRACKQCSREIGPSVLHFTQTHTSTDQPFEAKSQTSTTWSNSLFLTQSQRMTTNRYEPTFASCGLHMSLSNALGLSGD